MNKKENRMAVRQTAEKAVLRDEQNQRIQFAAANSVQEVLKSLHTTLRGLDAEAVMVSRTKYGSNKVTHEKKQSLAKRLAGCFYQSIYGDFVLSGCGIRHDRYGVPLFCTFGERAGGF